MAEKGKKMIGSYDVKVPENTDVTVGYDMTANKVKNFKFSGIWTWIVSKLKEESISDLNTTNKTVVGAIKEVNTPTFTTATSRANINSGESQSIIMGKIKKWLADLGAAAFCSVVNNLTTTTEGSVLDARQGKNLSDALTKLNTLMGNTDISAIGGGTLTGAINELNSKIAVLPETKIACTAITINTTKLSFTQLEKTEQLTTTVTPSNTTDVISWKSSNVDVATVTNTGLVKITGYGVATITVTCGTQTAICHVNVKQTETEVVSDGVVVPDLYNTGVENSIQLKEINTSSLSGTTRLQVTQQVADNFCDSDGVISNYHFNGIYVDFNKSITQTVTFKNCKFSGDDKIAYAVTVSTYGTDKGIIFENCEFSHYKSAVSSGTWKATFDKCYAHDMMQDAFKINHSDIYLKNSYIHSLGMDTTSHADGVQIENNTAEVTVHIYNCRFDQPYTSGNTENAAIFAKCKDANIILDIQKCCATGGNYATYALNSETAKVSGKIECVVGCSSRYEIANIADGVEQNVVSAGSLFVSTVQNDKLYVTNYTNNERTLKIVTDTGEKTVTIPKSPTYNENHMQEFSEYPFNVQVEYPAGASWVKCYENDNLIRTQKLGE